MIILNSKPTKRKIDEIIIHCTATPEGRNVSVQTIRKWHTDKGWSDIGYHFIVLLDGSISSGRPEDKIGAHVEGHNKGTLGIVYVGGYTNDGKRTPKDTRTISQKKSLVQLCKLLLIRYPTIKKISGHNEYDNKACPCFNVRTDELGRLV